MARISARRNLQHNTHPSDNTILNLRRQNHLLPLKEKRSSNRRARRSPLPAHPESAAVLLLTNLHPTNSTIAIFLRRRKNNYSTYRFSMQRPRSRSTAVQVFRRRRACAYVPVRRRVFPWRAGAEGTGGRGQEGVWTEGG